ncbi:MAG: hypothetical protein K8M05_37505, partial [Deltaproteobacteria bacterium]|nr:hypothetical protein [Kofleriaceae bacterium]
MTDPLTLPALFTWLEDHAPGPRPRLAVAAGTSMARTVVRLARRLGHCPVVVTTPLELFWLLDDARVTVELVVGDAEMPTATGYELLRVVAEEWPDVCALVIDGARRPPAR